MTKSQKFLSLRAGVAPVVLGFALISAPAFAQVDESQGAPVSAVPEAEAVEEDGLIVVTGSRIARPDLTSTSPLAVVTNEEFELSGSVNVEQVLNTLPQVVPGLTGFSNNPGNGAVTLDLRGLGSTRTLVLVNGRRYLFYDESQVVDANTIPQFLIEGVDVVTGGASAVYGSDAIAGVVNFRLREDLEGIHAGALYGITERGDGARYTADLALGTQFDDGRGHVTAYASYTERKPIFAGSRDFSRFAAGDACITPGSTDPDTGVGSAIGGALGTCVSRGGEVGLSAGGSTSTDTATIVGISPSLIFDPATGNLRDFNSITDNFNFAPANYLQLPQERYLIGAYGSYELAEGIEPFMEVSFVNNVVATELAATPATTIPGVALDIDSPFFSPQAQALLAQRFANPADPGYTTPLFIGRRFQEAGPRNSNFNRDAFRVLAGVRGGLTDTLNYEVYYSYQRTRNTAFQTGNIATSRFRFATTTDTDPVTGALRCRDAGARAAGCVPLNIFGRDTASPEAIDYVTVASTNQNISELKNAVGVISGPLFNLGMGAPDVGFALGAEYRAPRARFIPDEFLSAGDVQGFNAGQPTFGEYDVREIFGELAIPIIRDSFIHRLDLNGAARYSDYSLENVGGVWTYSGGVELAPIPDLTFRAQYQRAVRAPNVSELFGGSSTGFPAAIDPCGSLASATARADPAVTALCIAQGVPAANVFSPTVQTNAQIQADFGGNPNLQEEKSDTYTIGAIFSPSFIPRLNVTVDYYNIKVEDVVGLAGGGLGSALSLCFTVVQDANNEICQLFATARSPAGALGATTGGQNVQIITANNALLETSGIDVQVDYSLPLGFSLMGGAESRLSFFYLATFLDKFRSTALASIPERVLLLEGTGDLPEYKHTARLSLQDGPATVSLRWRYIDETEDGRLNNTFTGLDRTPQDPALFPNATIDAVNYFDLSLGFDVNDNFNLTMGVNNLLDEQPEVLGLAQEQSNTLPSLFDVVGRDYFVSARLQF